MGHVKSAIFLQKKAEQGFNAINLGTGVGYSVLQVIQAFEKASGKKIPYVIDSRRPGDVASSYSDATLAEKLLEWKATKDLNNMCKYMKHS